MVRDDVFDAFLTQQHRAGLALSAASDLVDLTPASGDSGDRWIAVLRCHGLIHEHGEVRPADRFVFGIRFGREYLRRVDAAQALTVLSPMNIFHPAVFGPWICPGHLLPGTPLVDLVHQLHEIVAWHRVIYDERYALNPAACSFARQYRHRFPLDRRPLRRSPRSIGGVPAGAGS